MSSEPKGANRALFAWLWAASLALGLADVAQNGAALDAREGLATAQLWWALGLPAAAGLTAVGLLLGRLFCARRDGLRLACLWTGLQGMALFAFSQGLVGLVGLFFASAAAASGVFALGRRQLLREPLLACACALLLFGVAGCAWLGASALLRGAWALSFGAGAAFVLARPGLLPARLEGLAWGVLGLLFALAVGALGARVDEPATPRAPASRPHVALVVLDTQRADFLGAYGAPAGSSPVFDRLAATGTLFENAYAPAPWTVPSHASLFTGLSPREHGTHFDEHRWLDGEFRTLAEVLAGEGYATASFAANRYLSECNLDQGFDLRVQAGARFRRLALRPFVELLGWPAKWSDQGAGDLLEATSEYLAAASGEPQFLFFNLLEPHWRYLPPASERRRSFGLGLEYLRATRRSMRTYGPLLMAEGSEDAALRETVAELYRAAVRYQDARLGELTALLDATLGLENTLLVVTADHGENLGEGGRWDHVFATNEHLLRVPLLFAHPSLAPRGERVAGLATLEDVAPTVLARLGLEEGLAASTADLLAAEFAGHPYVVAQGDPYYGHLERMTPHAGLRRDVGRFARPLVAIRSPSHRLVVPSRGEPSLYALSADPDELDDRLGEEPEVAAELARALRAWLDAHPRYVGRDRSSEPMSPEAMAALEALGYAGD